MTKSRTFSAIALIGGLLFVDPPPAHAEMGGAGCVSGPQQLIVCASYTATPVPATAVVAVHFTCSAHSGGVWTGIDTCWFFRNGIRRATAVPLVNPAPGATNVATSSLTVAPGQFDLCVLGYVRDAFGAVTWAPYSQTLYCVPLEWG